MMTWSNKYQHVHLIIEFVNTATRDVGLISWKLSIQTKTAFFIKDKTQ